MKTPHAVLVSAGAVSLAFSVSGANAQQLPPEGKFSITYTSLNATPVKPIAIGKDLEMSVSSAMMTATNDSGGGLLHNLTGRCLMSVLIDKAAKTIDQHGYCTYTDADGDQVFEKVDIDKQALGPVIVAKAEWIGGTGKYAGLQGLFEVRHNPLKSPTEGVVQGAGKKIGSYRVK
jgi:hypothetical protein